MTPRTNNYAFIDSQNVNLAIRDQGWLLSWRKFRVYLREKYRVQKAYMFIGYIRTNEKMYSSLRESGYELIFKPVVLYDGDQVKGNIDAELVLQAMIDYDKYDQAIIVSGDGDFYCLVKYLRSKQKLARLLVPNKYKYSRLLRQVLPVNGIAFMNDLKKRLEYNSPALRRDYSGGST